VLLDSCYSILFHRPSVEIVPELLSSAEADLENGAKDVETIAALLKKGMFGPGAFQTADCRKTFEELKSKGVEFVSEPKGQFYGVEAVFKDPFGNWFSLTQRKNY